MYGFGFQELLLVAIVIGVPGGLWWIGHRRSAMYPIEHGAPIAGWLVLFAVGTCLLPFILANAIYEFLRTSDWRTLTPIQVGLISVVGTVLVVWSIWNAVLFFRRQRMFPWAWIGLQATMSALIIADAIMDSKSAWGGLLGTFFWTGFWACYLLMSRRAKATFVRVTPPAALVGAERSEGQ